MDKSPPWPTSRPRCRDFWIVFMCSAGSLLPASFWDWRRNRFAVAVVGHWNDPLPVSASCDSRRGGRITGLRGVPDEPDWLGGVPTDVIAHLGSPARAGFARAGARAAMNPTSGGRSFWMKVTEYSQPGRNQLNRIHIIFAIALLAAGAVTAGAQQSSSSSFELGSISTPRTINPAANSTTPSSLAGQQQNPFLGSVPTGKLTDQVLQLSLSDAIDRGLRSNLGVVENEASLRQSQAQRLRALSTMIPNVSALLRQNLDQLSRVATGLKIPGLPDSTGQFGYQESYLAFSDTGLNLESLYQYRAARRAVDAQRLSLDDAGNVVTLAVGTAYLQVQASESRVDTAKAELAADRELETQTLNRVQSGLAADIEGLRATVQRQTSEQRLTVAQANLEKDRLTLARIIGLPSGQQFTTTTKAAYQPWTGGELEAALRQARNDRADLKSEIGRSVV